MFTLLHGCITYYSSTVLQFCCNSSGREIERVPLFQSYIASLKSCPDALIVKKANGYTVPFLTCEQHSSPYDHSVAHNIAFVLEDFQIFQP